MLKINDRVQIKGTNMRGTVVQVVGEDVADVKFDDGVLAYTMCRELELLPVDKKTIRIKYFDDAKKLEKISKGDWIDLYANKEMFIPEGEKAMIPLGVAMELPEGYEAHVVPRSSTFKTWGIIQTNSFGVIDHSYCGDNDQWHFPAFCLVGKDIKEEIEVITREIDTEVFYEQHKVKVNGTWVHKGDKICQFRIMEVQPRIEFEEVEVLGNADRGGFGSTGTK